MLVFISNLLRHTYVLFLSLQYAKAETKIIYGGNAYDIGNYYFGLTNIKVNVSMWVNEMESCPRPPMNAKCLAKAMLSKVDQTRLWKSSSESPDCNYNITLEEVVENKIEILFFFAIQQSQCRQGASKSGDVHAGSSVNDPCYGGSTFDIHAFDLFSVVYCDIIDEMSNRYTVLCRLPQFSDYHQSANETKCVTLTAILSREHYDSYAEAFYGYSPIKTDALQFVVADNITFCAKSHILRPPPSPSYKFLATKNESLPFMMVDLPTDVPWYTGRWLTEDAIKALESSGNLHSDVTSMPSTFSGSEEANCTDDDECYTSLMEYEERLGVVNSGYAYHKHHNSLINRTDFVLAYPERCSALSMASPQSLADKYTFVPCVYHSNSSSSQAVDPDHPNLHFLFSTGYDADKLALRTNKWKYIFMGDSHMRYNFHTIVAHVLGTEALKDIPPHGKHEDIMIHKFHYDFNPFASGNSFSIQGFCEQMQESNRLLFIQPGVWDQKNYGLRYILQRNHSTVSAMKLLATLELIFSGNMSCPSLAHIVWMTAVPYPLCFGHKTCVDMQWMLYNSNMIALNEFYVTSILNLYRLYPSAKDRLKLSIIDAFNIVAPRLLFNPDNEVVQTNHFTNRVKNYNIEIESVGSSLSRRRSHRHARDHNRTASPWQGVIVTPGGSAVIQAMLLAMKHAASSG